MGSNNTMLYRRMVRARSLIDELYYLPLDVGQLADHASFSRYHFIRSFRSAFDVTPHQYLMRRRVERAKMLLRAGELSVTEICFEVGFQSLGSFSSLFRRTAGYAPTEYRATVWAALAIPRPFIPACYQIMYGLGAPGVHKNAKSL